MGYQAYEGLIRKSLNRKNNYSENIGVQCKSCTGSRMVYRISQKVPERRKPYLSRELIREYFKLYSDRSTIHGVRYIFDDNVTDIERLCWMVIVIAAVTVTFIWFILLSKLYNDQTLVTVVDDSRYPVFNVYFPAVAICSQQRVNWDNFEESKRVFLPPNATNDTQEIFHEFVRRMATLRFGTFEQFENMNTTDLEKLNFINVTSLAKFLSFTCEDMFDTCKWRKNHFPCCDLFVLEKCEVGLCMVFNSAISEASKKKVADDPFYPWRNNKSGEDTSLVIKLKLKTSSTNATAGNNGVLLMVKKDQQWTDVVYSINGNSDTLVIIQPQLSGAEPNTQDTPPEIRGCIFDTEKDHYLYKNIKGLRYHQWNCLTVCHEEHLVQYCNCTLPMFFPYNASLRECKTADFVCMSNHRDIFSFDKRLNEEAFVKNLQGGMLCPCLINCNAVEYFVSVSTLPSLNQHLNDTKTITIDVHFQSEVMLKYSTSREFTYFEMIASAGGIVALFLGASLVSLVEIFYHLTFVFCTFFTEYQLFDQLNERSPQVFSREKMGT